MGTRQYAVYILTNAAHTVLYTGVTNDLQRRVGEHKSRQDNSFTSKYHVDQLVYFELGDDIRQAIAREKQIKGGSRQKKLHLINAFNPDWKDLYQELFVQAAQR